MASPGVFYHVPITKKSIFDRCMLAVVGPAFATPFIAILALFLSELQRIFFLCEITFNYFTLHTGFSAPFVKIIYWGTYYFITEINRSKTLIGVSVGLILAFLAFIWIYFGFVFWKTSTSQKAISTIAGILRRIGVVYQGILYTIIHTILVGCLVNLKDNPNSLEFSSTYKLAMFLVVLIFATINFFTALMLVLFSSEPLHFTSDITARRSNLPTFLSFLQKTVVVIVLASVESSHDKALIASVFTTIIDLIALASFYRDMPYYKIITLRVEMAIRLSSFFISFLNLLLGGLAGRTDLSLVMLLTIFIVIYSTRLSRNIIETKIRAVSTKSVRQLASETDIFMHFAQLENIIGKGRYNPQFDDYKAPNITPYYLMGIIKEHSNKCHVSRCACKFYIPKQYDSLNGNKAKSPEDVVEQRYFNIDEQNMLHDELMYHFKKDYLSRMTVMFPDWHHLKLTLANFVIGKQWENKVKALLMLYEVEKQTDSFLLKTKVAQLKWLVEKSLRNDEINELEYKSKLNIKSFIGSYNFFDELSSHVTKQVEYHLRFWKELDIPEPHLIQLLDTSNECEKSYQKLRKIWDRKEKIMDKTFLKAYFFYGLFLRVVKNVREESDVILKRAMNAYRVLTLHQKADKGVDLATLYNETNLVVRISLQTDNFGRIIAISNNVLDHFGYEASAFLNKNVNALMPDFIRSRHDDILRNYLSNGKESSINKNRKVFGLHKNGYLIPFYMYITPFPHLESDYSIMAILKRVSYREDILMVSPTGMIEGLTKDIADNLGLTAQTYPEANLSSYCEKFPNINMVFNYFAYVKMKSNQSRIKVYEQVDLLDKQILAQKSEALLAIGHDHINKNSNRGIMVEETTTLFVDRMGTAGSGEKRDSGKILKSIRSSKFKREFREASVRKSSEHDRFQSTDEKTNTPTNDNIHKAHHNDKYNDKIVNFGSEIFQKYNRRESPGLKKGIQSFNSGTLEAGTPGTSPLPFRAPNHEYFHLPTKFSSAGRTSDAGSTQSFLTHGQKLVKDFQQVLKSEHSAKAYAPTHQPEFYARESMLARRSLLERASIFNKFAPIAKDLSAQARNALHEEYKNIYEQFLYQGQMLRFMKFDAEKQEVKDFFYFVKVHDEKVHHDILRIFTLVSSEKKLNDDNNNSSDSSESFYIDDASIHSKVALADLKTTSPGLLAPGNNLNVPSAGQYTSQLVPTYSDIKSLRPEEKRLKYKRKNNIGLDEEHELKKRGHKNIFLAKLFRKTEKLIDGDGKEDDNDASSVQSKKTIQSLDRKIEKAINSNKVDREVGVIFRAMVTLYAVMIIFLICIWVNINSKTSQAWRLVTLVENTCYRDINLLEITRRLEQVDFIQSGDMSMYSLTDAMDSMDSAILTSQDKNTAMRQDLNFLNKDFQNTIFDLKTTELAELNPLAGLSNQQVNTFDLAKDILNGATTLFALLEASSSDARIPDLKNYLYQNIMRGTVPTMNRLILLEVQDSESILDNAKKLNQIFLFTGLAIIAFVLFYIILHEQKFLSKKKMFLNIWCAVQPTEIDTHKKGITDFCDYVELDDGSNPYLFHRFNTVTTHRAIMTQKNQKRTKEGNFNKIQYKGLVNISIQVLILAILAIILAILFIQSSGIQTEFSNGINRLQKVLVNYHSIELGIAGLYAYIAGNSGIILQGQQLKDALDTLFDDLGEVNNIFKTLRSGDEALDNDLGEYFKGDLCQLVLKNDEECTQIGQGVLTRGMSAVQSFMAESLEEIKGEYESSDPTISDIGNILTDQNFIDMETVFSQYVKIVFDQLKVKLETDFKEKFDHFKMRYIGLIIGFIVFIIIVLIPLSGFGGRSMVEDRINLRKMLRMVNTTYVLDHKLFRAALKRDMGKDLNFV